MRLGRPIQSDIRQNIVEILYFLKKGYGYEIHKIYKDIFAPCTREVVYYHLRKGSAIGEFKVEEVKKEEGKFSWGSTAEKIYYALGPNAKPAMNARVRKYFERRLKSNQ
jgi:hypothetical protein